MPSTMPSTTVRIGLIGAGGIAGAHVAGYLRNSETVTFAAVADPVRESAERRAGDTGAAIYADYTTMLAEADIDAVDICLPHHLHKDALVAGGRARPRRQAHPVREAAVSEPGGGGGGGCGGHRRRRDPDVRAQPAVPSGRR